MKSTFTLAALLVAAFALTGCAINPQMPVELTPATISASSSQKIGVAATPMPKISTTYPGADCLLCILAASATNSGISNHADTLGLEDLPKLKERVAASLQKRGLNAIVIPEPVDTKALNNSTGDAPNTPRKNFDAVGKRYGVDKLLLIDVTQVGFERTYATYFPRGEPRAIVRGSGALIDLKTNRYEWYTPLNLTRSAEGAWDESPKYPGLTNAYFQTLEMAQDQILKPWGK